MKKQWIAIAGLLFAVGKAGAQHCQQPFLGSKTLYSSQYKISAAPKNYTAVFINHVGRHGARHLTSDPSGSALAVLLQQADSVGGLTTAGKELREQVINLAKIEKPNVKSISFEGIDEQHGIAARMYTNYRAVFDHPHPVIHIDYTKEIRTLQTADAFMEAFTKKIHIPAVSKQINDTTLRFYDIAPAYLSYKKKGNWLQAWDQLKTTLHYKELANTTAQKFFTAAWLPNLSEADKEEIISGLYGFISIRYSIQKEITDAGYTAAELDMEKYFDCKQLMLLSDIDNAEDFFLKGPGSKPGIQVNIAAPLLADFIVSTDAFIKDRSSQAKLRFSHAETIAPFAALLSLDMAGTPVADPSKIAKSWNAGKVIPLSSNIQWILYQQKGSDNYLIKFLLNEKETAVTGLSTKTFPYYEWNAAREFYLRKLQSLGLQQGANYFDYLQHLQ